MASPCSNTFIRAFAAFLLSFALVSCGGGGNSSPTASPTNPTTISPIGSTDSLSTGSPSESTNTPTIVLVNEVLVPQAPDLVANATLLGVDNNNNGIRDDVERLLAARFGSKHNGVLLSLAKTYQEFLSIPLVNTGALRTSFISLLTQSKCLPVELKTANATGWIGFASLDSIARLRAFEARTAAINTSTENLPASSVDCGR